MRREEQKLDVNTIIQVKNLFNSGGWKLYESRLLDALKVLNYKIQDLTNGIDALTPDRVEQLKQNIAERKVLRYLIVTKFDLLDSVDPGWEEQINNDRFGLEKEIENSPALVRGA